MMDYIKNSLKSIGKLRNILTLVAISIGVASVVLIASIGEIGKYTINSEINTFGLGSVTVKANSSVTNVSLDSDDLEIIRKQDFVKNAIPLMANFGKITVQESVENCIMWGIDNSADLVISLDTVYGRLIGNDDIKNHAKTCIIDTGLAQQLYKRTNVVGKQITLTINNKTDTFTIVGVASAGGNLLQSVVGNIVPMFVYLPYTTMQDLLGKSTFDQIAVKFDQSYDEDVASQKLVDVLSNSYGKEDIFETQNITQQKDKLNNILNMVTLVLSAIAGISLIVSGLGIMTVMLVSVNERTKEIGIKKAIGAKNKDIMTEFLVDAFTLSLIGSIIGLSIGLLIVVGVSLLLDLPIIINTQILVICVLFSIIVGIVFSVYPARTAAKMRPVDALRSE